MSESTARDDAAPAAALSRYVAAAEAGRPGLWRIAAVLTIVASVWIVATAIGLAVAAAVVAAAAAQSDWVAFGDAARAPEAQLFGALFGLAAAGPVLGAAMRRFHGRGLRSLLSARRRASLPSILLGGGVALAVTALALGLALRLDWVAVSTRPTSAWYPAFALLLLLLIAGQATAEEFVFRGYLPQEAARRSRHWAAWALAPSLLFGALHLGPNGGWAYAAATALFALAAVAVVARTGGLSAVIGFHVVNNWIALAALNTPIGLPGAGPVTVSVAPDATLAVAALDIGALLVGAALLAAIAPREWDAQTSPPASPPPSPSATSRAT